jgi:hypothetical protein
MGRIGQVDENEHGSPPATGLFVTYNPLLETQRAQREQFFLKKSVSKH